MSLFRVKPFYTLFTDPDTQQEDGARRSGRSPESCSSNSITCYDMLCYVTVYYNMVYCIIPYHIIPYHIMLARAPTSGGFSCIQSSAAPGRDMILKSYPALVLPTHLHIYTSTLTLYTSIHNFIH